MKTIKKIFTYLSALALLSTTPVALNAYNMNEPKVFVQSNKRDLHISFNKDGSKFAYTRLKDEGMQTTSEIVINDNGIEKIISQGFLDIKPVFSPDSKRIAFFRGIGMGFGYVCVSDLDGQNLEQIVPTEITKVSWSPDGEEIAFTAPYVEKKTTILTENDIKELKKQFGKSIPYKPGDKFQYEQTYMAIALADVKTKEIKYLTTNEGDCENPEFTADGKILYTFRKDRLGDDQEVWAMDKDGKNKKPVVKPENYEKKTINNDRSATYHIKKGYFNGGGNISVDGDMMSYMLTTREAIVKYTSVGKTLKYNTEKIKDDIHIGIYVKNLKTGETNLVTDEGSLWFPTIKNNKVYFSRYDNEETEHDIYCINLK